MIYRAILPLFVVCWYVAARSIIFYYFMGGGREQPNMAFMDWWASWFFAVPLTLVSLGFIGGSILVICWVINGKVP